MHAANVISNCVSKHIDLCPCSKGNVYEVKGEEEQVIDRMMRLNDALNLQLEKQREKITYLTQENKRLVQTK